ncbi:MAG: glycosyltransferase [Acidobacteriaceae bacterium]
MSKPRILHVGKFYTPAPGGIETHVHDLAVRQARVASVSVLVSNGPARSEVSEVEGVKVTRLARLGTIASMPICPALRGAIRDSPADIVHIHMPNPSSALAFLNSGHKGRLIVTHHADTLGRKFLRLFSDPFVARLMAVANCIIVTSERYLRSSEELKPFRDKCRIIPLGINLERRSPEVEDVLEYRRRHEQRRLLAIGRLVPYKGFDVLIRAMKHIDGHLDIIGEGREAQTLAALIEEEHVTHKVRMHGWVGDLRSYLDEASIFVMPSTTRAEAFGLVQLEAMAAGLPVINTEIDSGVPEVSINGKTGLTVPPGDEKALADAVSLLLDRRDLRESFGVAAMARVQAIYTADRMADRTMALYQNVLAA